MKNKYLLLFIAPIIFLLTAPKIGEAHCPLCTAGAGALAVFAISMGMSTAIVGLFIGAFSAALGLWFSKLVKKEYIKFQNALIAAAVFFLTVLPLLPLADEYRSFSIFLYGNYGSLLNRTYLINNFLFGSILGGIILFVADKISRIITKLNRGKTIPFQRILITFLTLIIVALLLQFVI